LSVYGGIEVNVITFKIGIEYSTARYHYIKRFTGTKWDYLLNLFRVKKLVNMINPDLLHAHYATSNGLMAAFSGFQPLIITGWGSDIFDSPKYFPMRQMLKFSLGKAREVTVLSNITKLEISKYTSNNISIIPFGVDLEKFSKSSENKDEIIKIGTVRTLARKYGVEYLIKAFATLSKNHENIRLEIVGDGDLRLVLEQLSKDLLIENKVVFHGFINQESEFDKYIAILRSFDIFCIPSIQDSETFGVAAVEALACSIPVVATNVGGLPEVVVEGETGFLVPPEDNDSIASAIENLICDPEKRKIMGKKGRKSAEDNFDWKMNVRQMVDLYYETIKKQDL